MHIIANDAIRTQVCILIKGGFQNGQNIEIKIFPCNLSKVTNFILKNEYGYIKILLYAMICT